MTFDIRTLLLILIISSLLQATALYIQTVLNKTYNGINWWMWGFLSITCGFILLSTRDNVSIRLVSIIIADLLFVIGLASLYVGTLRFLGKKENRILVISVLGAFLLVYVYFTYISDNYSVRLAASSISLAIFALSAAWQLLKNKPVDIAVSTNLVCVIFLFYGIFYAYRAVAVVYTDPITNLLDPTTLQILTFLVPFIVGILLTFSLIMMVNQRLHAEMRQATMYFETIFNTSPDATTISRLTDGYFINVNDGFVALSGFTREDTIGKSVQSINIWQNPVDRQRMVDLVKEKGSIRNYEAVLLAKNGAHIFGLVSARIIDLNGVTHLLSITRDISDRKRAEQALQESEESFRLLFENMNEGVALHELVHDEKGNPVDYRILRVNRAYEKAIGISAKQSIGALASQLYGNGTPPYLKEYAGVAKTGLPIFFEVYFEPLHKYFNISVFSPQKDHFATVFQDVTESKQANAALKESEEKYRLLHENSGIGIGYYKTDGTVISYNNLAAGNMNGKPEDFNGKSVYELFPKEYADFYKARIDKCAFSDRPQVYEDLVPLPKGYKYFLSTFTKICDSNNNILGIQILSQDITERKKLEAEVKDLYEKEKLHRQALEEEAKLRLRFIDVLAHELRAPLTPIMASSGMLQELFSEDSNSPQKKLADNIYRSTNIMLKRLEELLDVARFSRGDISLHLEPTELTSYLKSVVFRYQPSLDRQNQKLLLEFPDVLPSITLDRSRIEQVIVNLLSNASKYSSTESNIKFHAETENEGLLIEVNDEGMGISPEDQAKLFQPYQRVGQDTQKTKGLGLGLTVVKQIIEAHRGRIWVTSELGKGSTFSFWIPFQT